MCVTWRSVDSGDKWLPIQHGSCFWKVPLAPKVAFCFGKRPHTDIPLSSSRKAEHQNQQQLFKMGRLEKPLESPLLPPSIFQMEKAKLEK